MESPLSPGTKKGINVYIDKILHRYAIKLNLLFKPQQHGQLATSLVPLIVWHPRDHVFIFGKKRHCKM